MKTIKEICCFNKKLYELFINLIRNEPDLSDRLTVLDSFFLTYIEPKLTDFGFENIERFCGEEGPDEAYSFRLNYYELFLKETDPEIFKLFYEAKRMWMFQYQIISICKEE